jgi:hypothetical protein
MKMTIGMLTSQQWNDFFEKEKPNIISVLDQRNLALVEYTTLTTIAKFIGLSERQFRELPKKDPDNVDYSLT